MRQPGMVPYLVCLLGIGATLWLGQAWGQNDKYKRELFGRVGASNTAEDEGSLGNGIVYGGGFGFRVTSRWEFVAEGHSYSNHRPGNSGQFFSEGHSLTVGGCSLYHFSESRLQPYLRVGLTYGRFDGTKGFRPRPGDSLIPLDSGSRREGTQSFLGPEFGTGLKVFVSRKISLQPEVRLFLGGGKNYDPSTDIIEPGLFLASVTFAIGYHW